MLEFYEVNELEKKWEEYNKNRKRFSFLNLKDKTFSSFFGFDKIILFSLIFIVIIFSIVFWILRDSKSEIEIADINEINTENNKIVSSDKIIKTTQDDNMSYKVTEKSDNRLSLNINDIGIKSSEDSAGFVISNNYQQNSSNNINNISVPQNNSNLFNGIPTNEIIDFSNAPIKPKSNMAETKQKSNTPLSRKIEIKTSNLNNSKQTLVDKFNSTNKIEYSLMLAEEAYSKNDYDGAIKWALTSNEIDKDNVQSWIIFAKANYKKGKKDDAIYALETFNAKAKSSEIDNLISQIRGDSL